jgi:hypothetical protein
MMAYVPAFDAAKPTGLTPVDHERLPMVIAHFVDKLTRCGIVRINVTVSKVADPHNTRERTETGWRQNDSPRGIQLTVLGEPSAK